MVLLPVVVIVVVVVRRRAPVMVDKVAENLSGIGPSQEKFACSDNYRGAGFFVTKTW